MSIAKLNGLPKSKDYSAETVDRVKNLLNAGEVDVNDVSQYFGVSKNLIIQSLTDIPPDVYTKGTLTAPQVERVQDLIRKGVTSTGDVSEYFNAPSEIIERNLTQELGFNPGQIAEAQSGAPVSAAPAPVAEVSPTPTPTSAAIPSGTMYTADRLPGIDTPAATPAATPGGVNDFDALAGRGYNLAPVATTQYQTGSEIPTGLRGSEMALKGGATALQQQMALSGALGQEAFDQAYQESPQMAFLREQGMRANLAGAGATGGLGGGNIQKELQRFGQGLASQGLQQQIGNLSGLSSMGQNAAGTMANIQTGLGSQQLQGQQTLGNQLAAQNARYGLPAAQTLGVLGTNLAAGRTRAGEQLATQYGGAAANLADIYSNQGSNLATMLGGQRNMLMDQYNSAALNEARAQQGYGADMSNIQSGIGGSIAGVPQAQINTPNYQAATQNALNAGALGYGMIKDANSNATQPNTGAFQFGAGFQPGYFNQPTTGFMPPPTTAGMPNTTTMPT